MEHQVKTPYGTVTFKNDCPPERLKEVLAEYAYRIGYLEMKRGGKENAA